MLNGGWLARAAVSCLLYCLFFFSILILWCGVAYWRFRFLFFNLLGLASRYSSLPFFYGTFLHQVNCYIDVYFYMFVCRAWLARAAVSCFYLLFHLFLQVVIRPVRQHVSFILNHWLLGGADLQGQLLSTYQFFHICIVSVCIDLPLLLLWPIQGEEDFACMVNKSFFPSFFKYLIFRCCISFGWG